MVPRRALRQGPLARLHTIRIQLPISPALRGAGTGLGLLLLAVVVVWPAPGYAAKSDPRRFEPNTLRSGVTLPYPLDNLFRGYFKCGRRRHPALDIGGVGALAGLGTPIRAMVRSKIVRIGRPEDNPKRYGTPDTRSGEVTRGRRKLPRSQEIPGYGKVHFFTKDYGSSRTGVVIVLRGLEGRLRNYTMHYMHLGAVHPSLKAGMTVEAGQEIGLMGGTAVQESAPHLHLAIRNRQGNRIDVGPLLGIGSTRLPCNRKRAWQARSRYQKRARKLMKTFVRERAKHKPISQAALTGCGSWVHEGVFKRGPAEEHRVTVDPTEAKGRWRVHLEVLGGSWKPRLEVRSAAGRLLHTGRGASPKLMRRYRFKTMANGTKGGHAEIRLQPRKSALVFSVKAWKRRRPPRDASYRLTIERPCKAP